MALNQPNPFLLPNIISNVFHHIAKPSILEQLRLVCRCWNHEACIVLRQLRTIEFTSLQSLADYNDAYQLTEETFQTFPHCKFRFYFYSISDKQNPDLRKSFASKSGFQMQQEISAFVDRFGGHVSSCYLPVRSVNFDASFLDQVLSQLPNITVLGLHFQYYHQQTLPVQFSLDTIRNLKRVSSLVVQVDGLEISAERTQELLSMLFLHLSNLEKIASLGDIRRISKTGLFLRDILLESGDATSSNLKKLAEWNFKTRLLEVQCLQLLCTDFPIRTLYVDLYNPDDDQACVSPDIMTGLLRKWSSTLAHLEVELPYRKEVSFHFQFPVVMENLSTLYLGGFEGCFLTLIKMLPKLKNLELSQLDLTAILPKPNETVDVYKNVKRLKVDFCLGQTAGIISRFSRIFPQLQALNINRATDAVARIIFQKMSHLETLWLQGTDLTDAGICGFSEYELNENDFMTMSPKSANKFRKYPYIADLKELHYLELDAYALTEITVRHGLVHCYSLRLVKMDTTGGTGRGESSTILSRKFKLSEYENHMIEEGGAVVEMLQEPPLDDDALEFFQSHKKYCSGDDMNTNY